MGRASGSSNTTPFTYIVLRASQKSKAQSVANPRLLGIGRKVPSPKVCMKSQKVVIASIKKLSKNFDSPKGENSGGQKGKGLSPGGDAHHTKPDIEVVEAGVNVVAVRGAAVPWIDEPGAATNDFSNLFCSICSF